MSDNHTHSRTKRKKILPVKAVCRNCESALYGRYCHNCGQDLFKGTRRKLSSIVYHSAENLFAIDNKMFVSLKLLLFRPGKLTKEYLNGRIVSYIHPTKLFWFISILFFMLLSVDFSEEKKPVQSDKTNKEVEITTTSIEAVQKEVPDKTEKASDTKKREKDPENELLQYQIKQTFMQYAPYISFLLIPFFALLLSIFFWKKELFYADHLIFALHFHAFIFILFSLRILTDNILPSVDFGAFYFFFIPLIYFIWALRTVYRPKISTLFFKTFAIILTYGIAIVCSLILLSVVSVFLSGHREIIDEIIEDINS